MESVPEGLVTMGGAGGTLVSDGAPVYEIETVPAGTVSSPILVIICDGEPVRE